MVADGLTGKRMEWKLEVKDNEWKKKKTQNWTSTLNRPMMIIELRKMNSIFCTWDLKQTLRTQTPYTEHTTNAKCHSILLMTQAQNQLVTFKVFSVKSVT